MATGMVGGSALAASACGAPAATATAVEVPVDVDALCAKLLGIATPEANLHGVAVDRAGRVQLEAYFDGTDHPAASLLPRAASFTADDLHDVRSVTKSITAILFGVATDHGAIPGVDVPVLDYFPEYADLKGTAQSRITLADAAPLTTKS